MNLRTTTVAGVLAALPLLAWAGVNIDHIESATSSFDLVNDDIRIGANSTVKSLQTVNGGIELGDGSRAATVETVNGDIKLGARARVDDAETVNGSITAGAGLFVKDDLETVNGDIRIGASADIGGDVSTVNGAIVLDKAIVKGEISIVSGSVDTGSGSKIGSIRVEESNGDRNGKKRKPVVTIGANTVVDSVIFERDGELRVHRSAKLGKVSGVQAMPFD